MYHKILGRYEGTEIYFTFSEHIYLPTWFLALKLWSNDVFILNLTLSTLKFNICIASPHNFSWFFLYNFQRWLWQYPTWSSSSHLARRTRTSPRADPCSGCLPSHMPLIPDISTAERPEEIWETVQVYCAQSTLRICKTILCWSVFE